MRRLFLVVEGEKNGYPSQKYAHLQIVQDDPSTLRPVNPFSCSPIFSLGESCNVPFTKSGQYTLTFLMVPSPFPAFGKLLEECSSEETCRLWFSLGLANLIIIEPGHDKRFSARIIESLKTQTNITAYEHWTIHDGIIVNAKSDFTIENFDGKEEYVETIIPKSFPLHLKFAFSEYLMSVSKLLSASKKFTPHYYKQHLNTINASKTVMINDLCFLFGENSVQPSPIIIHSLNAKDKEEAIKRLGDDKYGQRIEAIINDYHGRIIQFNSSLSYVYTQAYAGTFPLFDHHGIIKRHSLLGIGSAIGALYELLIKLETAFSLIPFENFKNTHFDNVLPEKYLSILKSPTIYKPIIFENDIVIGKNSVAIIPADAETVDPNFFVRFAFYSGRLGFREYDYSATAATQVLVESHSLKWSIINYTHEIIHNHVRTILARNLLLEPSSKTGTEYKAYLKGLLTELEDIDYANPKEYKYSEFFRLILIQFSIHSLYMGSLSFSGDPEFEIDQMVDYDFPNVDELYSVIRDSYKDVNEIFVHVLDFVYVYRRDKRIYLTSIWSSWSTLPSVVIDVEQYFLRTLLVVALDIPGTPKDRFEQSKKLFLGVLAFIDRDDVGETILTKLTDLTNLDTESEMLGRFTNCIIVADIVYKFFTAKIEIFLKNGDKKVFSPPTPFFDMGVSDSMYDVNVDEFISKPILSKIGFLLDQTYRQCGVSKESDVDENIEKTSSWLLLALSSINK